MPVTKLIGLNTYLIWYCLNSSPNQTIIHHKLSFYLFIFFFLSLFLLLFHYWSSNDSRHQPERFFLFFHPFLPSSPSPPAGQGGERHAQGSCWIVCPLKHPHGLGKGISSPGSHSQGLKFKNHQWVYPKPCYTQYMASSSMSNINQHIFTCYEN